MRWRTSEEPRNKQELSAPPLGPGTEAVYTGSSNLLTDQASFIGRYIISCALPRNTPRYYITGTTTYVPEAELKEWTACCCNLVLRILIDFDDTIVPTDWASQCLDRACLRAVWSVSIFPCFHIGTFFLSNHRLILQSPFFSLSLLLFTGGRHSK